MEVQEAEEQRFLSVKNASDGHSGALVLTKDFTVEFRLTATDPQSAQFIIPIAALAGICQY
jgi:hypothetical protein